MSFKNPWRPLWQGRVYDSGYQYEKLEKVQKEDKTGLLTQLPQTENATIDRDDGYTYEYRVHPQFGIQISRKKTEGVSVPTPPKQPTGDLTSFMNDTTAAILAYHQKIDMIDIKLDKLLQVLTVTTKAEFQNAQSMKNNHGNEISGSDAASSGLGITENPVHITDEQTVEQHQN